jgi:hypothetical protein
MATADEIVTLMLNHMTDASSASHVPVPSGECLVVPRLSACPTPLGRGQNLTVGITSTHRLLSGTDGQQPGWPVFPGAGHHS